MLKTNEEKLVLTAVQGQIMYPRSHDWEVGHAGQPFVTPPGLGGITYNVKIGDSVYGWSSDHVEPGVTCTAGLEKLSDNPNKGFLTFSCIGNEARVISGDAKGTRGVVVGHHGGVEHVLIDFDDETLEKLTFDDKILIRCWGHGLTLPDHPDIAAFSLSPDLLHRIPCRDLGRGRLEVPVTARVPAVLMGSGLGYSDTYKSDYDIQTSDRQALEEHGLLGLRLGDLVAVLDHQAAHGWSYKRGALSIAVVIHGDSNLAGHGPGIQVLLTCSGDRLVPRPDPEANIGRYLGLGRYRKKGKKGKK